MFAVKSAFSLGMTTRAVPSCCRLIRAKRLLHVVGRVFAVAQGFADFTAHNGPYGEHAVKPFA
jgi:hypothetical protein